VNIRERAESIGRINWNHPSSPSLVDQVERLLIYTFAEGEKAGEVKGYEKGLADSKIVISALLEKGKDDQET
jgi:hypothetical protein